MLWDTLRKKASTRKSHFLKNATELLLAGLVVVITACKSKKMNVVNLVLVHAHIFENRMWSNMAETIQLRLSDAAAVYDQKQ